MAPELEEPTWKSTLPLLDLRDNWPEMDAEHKVRAFSRLDKEDANDFFLSLTPHEQSDLILHIPEGQRRLWLRLLPLDDITDVVQEVELDQRDQVLDALDSATRKEVTALLAYEEDEAGGLMNPNFIRVRPHMRVDEALRYLRKQAERKVEMLRYVYVLDTSQHLLGVASLRQLFVAPGDELVSEIMRTNIIKANETLDQEEVKHLFAKSALMAIPVVDDDNRIKGIVTVDDIVDVAEEEATEDIQKLGGSEVLDEPYLRISLLRMVKKRAGWLTVLFIGEMLTATAMGHFEKEIERAVVLALFIPLIISSGGNSGSQASTLVVRAIALGEVRLRDWWKVFARELLAGTALGCILGAIGFVRIMFWPARVALYGPHYALVAATVAASLVGIVLWGSLSGSMLPFLLKKLRFDPATASAPFVATLVDVSGLVIYFTVASFILNGVLL